ncbi:MAG: hypothetical protein KJ726_07785, partial [Verrucomicrobia bacterium]|nr:hypothetical protein [Verrucomicrobiota bacterium]
RMPVRMHPSQMNLLQSGFKGGLTSLTSDRLRKLDRQMKSVDQDVWYDTSSETWRLSGGGSAAGFFIGPDDGFLIWTRRSTNSWVWTNSLPYSLPTRLMTP